MITKVVLEHYRVKHGMLRFCLNAVNHYLILTFSEHKRAHAIWYKPYKYFGQTSSEGDSPGTSTISKLENLIQIEQYSAARKLASELIKASLDGIRYLET